MFSKFWFLMGCDDCTGYLTCAVLSDKSRKSLINAVTEFISHYKSRGHITQIICSDRERGISKDDIGLLGCKLDSTTSEGHEKTAERNIKTIKNIARSIAADAPVKKIPRKTIPSLIKFTCESINLRPNVNTPATTSPFILVNNTKLDMQRDLQVKWGELLPFHIPYNHDSASSRTSYGMVVGKEGRNLSVFDLTSRQIVTRRKFDRVSVPSDILTIAHQIADKDPATDLAPPIQDGIIPLTLPSATLNESNSNPNTHSSGNSRYSPTGRLTAIN